jgi:nucleoside-diphosphate-sugar epimerase
MKVVVIGATGTIGSAVCDALSTNYEVVRVSRSGPVKADLEDAATLRRLFENVRDIDAVVSCAGNTARRKPLAEQGETLDARRLG